MKLLIQLLVSGAILTACTSSPDPQTPLKSPSTLKPVPDAKVVETLTQGHTEFAVDLYKKLSANPDKTGKNIFVSPLSVSTVFGLAYAGARGETAQEMASVLHYTLPKEQLHPAMGKLTKTVENETEGQLFQMANALFVNQDTVLEPDYLTLTKTFYEAEQNRVNFKKRPEQAIEVINDWVKVKTRGLISEALKHTKDTKDTRNVLVNTAYLKASWANMFSKDLTQNGPFELVEGAIDIPLMHKQRSFPHMKGRGFSALELPYQNYAMSMILVLPDRAKDLAKLEAKLSADFIRKIEAELEIPKTYEVKVTLPKIDISDDYKLANDLMELGMPLAFSSDADFSGRINPKKQVDRYATRLSEVIHKTVLKVDETGTEAAAVSAIGEVVITAGPKKRPRVVEFKADHPFLTFIRHNETGAILFMGRINNPEAE